MNQTFPPDASSLLHPRPLINGRRIEDSYIAPPDGPGWGAEWDEEYFRSHIVTEH